jgi:hypothetical protein
MQREQFQLLLVRAAEVCARRELIVFGSQSVHAITTSPPLEVIISEECDIWLRDEPDVSARLVEQLGIDSPFAKSAGVYADAVPPDLPFVPMGWEERLVEHRLGDITVRCLEIHDLIVSKLSAGRLKDYEFIAAVFMTKLARVDEVAKRIQTFPDPHTQAVLLARLRISSEATDVHIA